MLCNFYFRSFTSPFSIYGIIWFGLLLTTQLPIIKYNNISSIAVLIYFLAYFAFLLPNLFGKYNAKSESFQSFKTINFIRLRRIARVCTWFYLLIILIYWFFVIKYFGSISFIFSHPFYVRSVSTGANGVQIAPIYVNYSLPIGYTAAGVCAFLLWFDKIKARKKIKYLIPMALVFVQDLATFSRMATIFFAIIYICTLFIKLNFVTKRERGRYIRFLFLAVLSAIVLIMLTKIIRSNGTDFGTEYDEFAYFKGDNFIKSTFLHLYTYTTGSFVAFSNFVDSFDSNFTFGYAQFLPMFNFLNRFLGLNMEHYNLVYEFTSVPYDTNVYTFLREAYTDFGIFGIILTPLFLGIVALVCKKCRFKNPYVKVVLLQYIYLYVIFGIFYTPYSQGGPVIGMLVYFIIILCCMKSKVLYSAKKNSIKVGNDNKLYNC